MPYTVQVGEDIVEFPDSVTPDQARDILRKRFKVGGASQPPGGSTGGVTGIHFDKYGQLSNVPIKAHVEGVGTLVFPDGTPLEVIQSKVKEYVSKSQIAASTPAPTRGLQQAVNHAGGFSRSHYAVSLGALFFLTIAFGWVLFRRTKSTQTVSCSKPTRGRADFKMASLGVKRLSLVLASLVATGAIAVAGFSLANDPSFSIAVMGVGLGVAAMTWLAVRGIDWIIRGFRFPD